MSKSGDKTQPQQYVTPDEILAFFDKQPESVDYEPHPGLCFQIRKIKDGAEWTQIMLAVHQAEENATQKGYPVNLGDGKVEVVKDGMLLRQLTAVSKLVAEPKRTISQWYILAKRTGPLLSSLAAKCFEVNGATADNDSVAEAKNDLGQADGMAEPSPLASGEPSDT